MEIIIGKSAGFCYGVKRAVEGAEGVVESNKKTYCLGELVHNKDVIKSLENKGICFVDNLDNVFDNVIIRAHGVAKNVYEYMKTNKINYFDYTCPNVLNIHKIVQEYAKEQYFIFLLGEKKHPENQGTISFCGENSFIIENEACVEEALENFRNSKIKRLLVITQTTYSVKTFENIISKIKQNIDSSIELVVRNTICNATEVRQKETEQLSRKVECMIIIGGKNSSNTKKLYDIACVNCKDSICIENMKELNIEHMKKYNVVGIMAGASTPQTSIEEVKKELEQCCNEVKVCYL